MGRKAIPEEKVAGIAADVYLGELTMDQIAAKHGVSHGSVGNVKKSDEFDRIKKASVDGVSLETLATNLIVQHIVTLQLQLEYAADPEWFKKQSAGDAATLFGVTSDKLVRLLGAVQRRADQAASAAENRLLGSDDPDQGQAPDDTDAERRPSQIS